MPNPVTLDPSTARLAMDTLTAANMLLVSLSQLADNSRPMLLSVADGILELRRTIARQYNAADLEAQIAKLERRIAEQDRALTSDRAALKDFRRLATEQRIDSQTY